ncbi:MAG: DUF86 domain-containing protein [Nitrospinae bacterium]|nr:DUF86 domain-containing protein [Nitrospinota bacterium]
MPRDYAYLLDMLNAARTALEYVRGKSHDQFRLDTLCQDAVVRRLEIIGEAASGVSEETRTVFASIPWRAMVAMRNVVIHEYDGVDMDIVWNTVQNR